MCCWEIVIWVERGEDVVEPYVRLLKLTGERSCADVLVGINRKNNCIAVGTPLSKFVTQVLPEDLSDVHLLFPCAQNLSTLLLIYRAGMGDV